MFEVLLLVLGQTGFAEEIFNFGGSVVSYYQAGNLASGAGYNVDLEGELNFPFVSFYARTHGGKGTGSEGNLNTLADDNTDDFVRVLESYAKLNWKNLEIYAGRTEPPVFIDQSDFANDEKTQFVSKPFVNNPIADSEFRFAPLVGFKLTVEKFELAGVYQSEEFTDWNFAHPFSAFQVSYIGERKTVRTYYWNSDTEEGNNWGIGVSGDYYLTERLGVFGRASYGEKDAYELNKFFSLGFVLKDIVFKGKDLIGLGTAVLAPTGSGKKEYHVETYYKVKVKNLSFSCGFQYVVNSYDFGLKNAYSFLFRTGIEF